jgi:hypothetical protein
VFYRTRYWKIMGFIGKLLEVDAKSLIANGRAKNKQNGMCDIQQRNN